MSDDYQRIELITGTARRRRWTTEQKLRIIEASYAPGESVSSVARRHGVALNLLYRWRRLMAEGGVAALVNRLLAAEGKAKANHERVFRIMKRQGPLVQRHTGRRKGRLNDGKVVVRRSNLRWCSDVFEITCWNGDIVRIVFVIECSRPLGARLACGGRHRHQQLDSTPSLKIGEVKSRNYEILSGRFKPALMMALLNGPAVCCKPDRLMEGIGLALLYRRRRLPA